jgi:hypothetical protein
MIAIGVQVMSEVERCLPFASRDANITAHEIEVPTIGFVLKGHVTRRELILNLAAKPLGDAVAGVTEDDVEHCFTFCIEQHFTGEVLAPVVIVIPEFLATERNIEEDGLIFCTREDRVCDGVFQGHDFSLWKAAPSAEQDRGVVKNSTLSPNSVSDQGCIYL